MAYNEEANIQHLLASLVSQQTSSVHITEIIVVASGCTDRTTQIVEQWAAREPRIRLLVQPSREGKASAINYFLQEACEKVVVLCGADLLPVGSAIEQLVAPFANSEVGMTTARPVPVNEPNTLMGFAAQMLWRLHHEINLLSFKAGELIAFRKIFQRIPYDTVVDEASLEPVIRGQGFAARYVPTAVVYNKGPETVKDFLSQRRRIYRGHLAVRNTLGYSVSTMNGRRVFWLVLRNLDWRLRPFIWTWAVIGLEVYGRWLGRRDYKTRLTRGVWEVAKTTKQLKVKASA